MVMGLTAALLLSVAKIWQHWGRVTLFPIAPTPEAIALGLAVALGIALASRAAYWLWPGYRQSADAYLQLVLRPLTLADLVWLGLLPGLSEELLFRGVMLPAWGSNWLAVVLTSCLFGVLHLNGWQQWPYALWAGIIGAVLGTTALLAGNLLVPTIAHVGTNAIAGTAWKLSHRHRSDSQ